MPAPTIDPSGWLRNLLSHLRRQIHTTDKQINDAFIMEHGAACLHEVAADVLHGVESFEDRTGVLRERLGRPRLSRAARRRLIDLLNEAHSNAMRADALSRALHPPEEAASAAVPTFRPAPYTRRVDLP